MLNSLKGMALGVGLLALGIVLPFLFEGAPNLANYAKKAAEYTAGSVIKDGTLVSVSGVMRAVGNYPEHGYLNGRFMAAEVVPQVYGWQLSTKTEKKDNLGGSTDTVKTTEAALRWLSDVKPFTAAEALVDGRETTVTNLQDYKAWIDSVKMPKTCAGAEIAGLVIDAKDAAKMRLAFTEADDAAYNPPAGARLSGGVMYLDNADPGAPKLGDKRVIINDVPESVEGTAFGQVSGGALTPFTVKRATLFGVRQADLFRCFRDASRSEAVSALSGERRTFLALARLACFLLFFFGLLNLAGPVLALLSVVPALARVTGAAAKVVIGAAALALTIVVDLLAIALNNWAVLIILLAGAAALAVFARKRKAAGAAPEAGA